MVRMILQRRKWQPLQYSCLENAKDGGAWQATVHWVAESDMTEHTHTHTHHHHPVWPLFLHQLPRTLAVSGSVSQTQDRNLTGENPGSCQPPSEQWEDGWAGEVSPSLKQLPFAALCLKRETNTLRSL